MPRDAEKPSRSQKNRLGKDLPPTCRGVTKNDTMIIHPYLMPWITQIEVRPDLEIDVHSPMLVTFENTTEQSPRLQLVTPTPIDKIPVDQRTWDNTYQTTRHGEPHTCQTPQELQHSIQKWARNVEKSLDQAIRHSHKHDPTKYPQKSLPTHSKGRSTEIRYREWRPPKLIKRDAFGLYEPPEEVNTLQTKHKVRQTRREDSQH